MTKVKAALGQSWLIQYTAVNILEYGQDNIADAEQVVGKKHWEESQGINMSLWRSKGRRHQWQQQYATEVKK